MARARGRVLVADDERTMLDLFRETLADEWDVDVAGDGSEASDLLSAHAYDLAFAVGDPDPEHRGWGTNWIMAPRDPGNTRHPSRSQPNAWE